MMKKPKGVAVMRITIKPKKGGSDESPVDDDPDDDYDGVQEDDESGHGEGMKEAMKLIQSLLGGGDEVDKAEDNVTWTSNDPRYHDTVMSGGMEHCANCGTKVGKCKCPCRVCGQSISEDDTCECGDE